MYLKAVILTLLPAVVFSKGYYTAAVFEHRVRATDTSHNTPGDIKAANAEFFAKAIQVASEHEADIIIFNEYGFNPYPGSRENMHNYAEYVPDPQRRKFNPCKDGASDRFILSTMSCLAQKTHMYVVINMLDIQPCQTQCDAENVAVCEDKCPDDDVYIYNTNVVFDREGTIVARYHKNHPYFELVNTPNEPEFVIFDTEFGRFGLIVCFDMVFEESYQLVKNYKIDTLIFPTCWFDDIGSLNAVEFQQAWALENEVNLLGANCQSACNGSLGSGIFSKELGALIYTYDNDGDSKLLLANVKIKHGVDIPETSSIVVIRDSEIFRKEKETGNFFPDQCYADYVGPAKNLTLDYRCFKSQTQNFTLTKLQTPSGTVQSCNNKFCCNLKYSANDLQEDWYLAALNGTNDVKGYYFWWEETCLLVRCDSFKNKECVMQPSISRTVFKSLELKAKFYVQRVYATVTKDRYRLAPKPEWNSSTENSETVLKFHSDSNVPLLKVALMGRNYDRDPAYVPWYQHSTPEIFYI